MQRGAPGYLLQPIDLGDLSRQALRRRHTYLEGRQINQWLKDEVSAQLGATGEQFEAVRTGVLVFLDDARA